MDDSRLERLEQRLDDMDQRNRAMERALDLAKDRSRQAMDMVVPNETRKHLRAAGREQLLALRSLLDFWVDKLAEGSDKTAQSNHADRENIPID